MRSTSRSPRFRRSVRVATALTGLAFLASVANAGGTLDLTITNVEVLQTVQNGSQTLAAKKATFVRATVLATGTVPPATVVDGVMRVFVDGEEAAFSPVYSDNGPIVPQASPSSAVLDDTLNFIFLPPEGDISVSVEVNPAGPVQVPETDFLNNTASTADEPFVCRRTPELIYVPIDYRPNHEPNPNVPDPELIKPGVGDNMMQGVYPSGDWYYHAAPPKLWGQSLSGTGSNLNAALTVDLQQMNPQPDFIYGWVAGGLPYNGQAIINGVSSMGNTQPIRHQRTFAHELGHCFGLLHNGASLGTVGIDVEHQLNETQALSQLKGSNLADIMVAGLLTNAAWIAPFNVDYLHNQSEFQCAAPAQLPPEPSLLVAGSWNFETGAFELLDTFVANSRPTANVPLEQANLLVRAHAGGEVVDEYGVYVAAPLDCSHGGESESIVDPVGVFVGSFQTSVDPNEIDGLSIIEVATGRELTVLQQSAHAPEIVFTAPSSGDLIGASTELTWAASDADGDVLRFYVRYSPDGERVIPLVSNWTEPRLVVDAASLPALAGGGYFEVLATDGLNTSRARVTGIAPGAQLLSAGGNAPVVHVATPDNGMVFPKGATVILHGSGWDEEDRALEGGSLVWSSDVDGIIGSGRLDAVAHLSVGTHVLTVTGTDSSGMDTSDSVTIAISARTLPDGNELICQASIGFGGPGSSLLSMCGGDLSAGTTSQLILEGAPAATLGVLLFGPAVGPLPIFGGQLAPSPFFVGPLLATDGSGSASLTVSGNANPSTAYVQCLVVDDSQPFGYGFSNALEVQYLP